MRVALIATAAVALTAVPALSARAPERLPEGSVVARVPVGGLDRDGAKKALRRALKPRYERLIEVRVGHTERSLRTLRAGQRIDYEGMVRRAFKLAARGKPVALPLRRSISAERLSAAVRRLAAPWYRAPRNARVKFGITHVARIRGHSGRRLDSGGLRRRLLAELRRPSAGRAVRAGLRQVRPRIRGRDLRRIYRTYVSIDRSSFTLRLFKRLRVVKRFQIAVGRAGFESPTGLRHVVEKQVDPAWHAPNKPWAGAFAGQTIPPGDPRNPLKARWLGLGGGVGIHGTAEEWTVGTRASHGCFRMRVAEVKRLYPRVPVGTPVLIR